MVTSSAFPIYGIANGKLDIVSNMPVGASEVFKGNSASGCFVVGDTAGRIEVADANDNSIYGWAMVGDLTASATEGGTELDVNISLDASYWMPVYSGSAITEAALQACVNEVRDLCVDSNIQRINIDAASKKHVKVVDYYWNSKSSTGALKVKISPDMFAAA